MDENRAKKKRLAELSASERKIKRERVEIFRSMGDPNREYLSEQMIMDIQEAMYDMYLEIGDVEIDTVIEEVLKDHGKDYDFYKQRKHDNLLKNAVKRILDGLIKHPLQTRMLRSKSMVRREMNKNKTPSSHLSAVERAIQRYDTHLSAKDRDRLEELDRIINGQILERISSLESAVMDNRERTTNITKHLVYEMKQSGMTHKEISTKLNIGERTSKRYYSEMKHLLEQI
jgi:molybdopterin converting factor small subunit